MIFLNLRFYFFQNQNKPRIFGFFDTKSDKIRSRKSIKQLNGVQSYINQVLQTIQMKLILLSVWAEPAVLGSAKTALKFKYKIQIGYYSYTIQSMGQFMSFKSEINNP